MPTGRDDVRFQGKTGSHLLRASISHLDPGCVKTRTNQECAELFSLSSSPSGGREYFWFLIDGIETEFLRADCASEFSRSQDPRRTSQGEVDGLACGNPRLTLLLEFPEGQMSPMTALVLAVLGSLYLPGQAFAQLTPPAGSAGAGNSAISGVPYGPANPRVLSDPSGIGNASSLPPLRSNTPAPVVSSTPTAPTRVVTPPSYPSASQQIISTIAVEPRSKAPPRRRGRPQVSSFTGICRGC